MSQLGFSLHNINNICLLVNRQEPFFGYLLSGIKIKLGKYPNFKYMACDSSCIYIQEEYVNEVENDKSKLKEFSIIMLHEIFHIYYHHSWRYGFSNNAVYSKHKDKAGWLATVINMVLDAIINTNLIAAGYSFGSLEYVALKHLLRPDHPRINSNDWTEDELLLEVLSNIKTKVINQQGDGDASNGDSEGGEIYEIEFPSGKKVITGKTERDVIFSNKSGKEGEEEIDSLDSISDIAKKAANNLRQSGKFPGEASKGIMPPELVATKSNDLSWEERLKQFALQCFNNRVTTNYETVVQDNFYGFELGLTSFNRCAIEHPYKPLPEPNTVAVYIDLSGSIFCCPETLSKFLAQVTDIAEFVGNLLLITFDDGMTGSYLFNMSEVQEPLGDLLLREKDKYLLGGGGTDVIPLFKDFFEDYANCDLDVNVDNICMLVVLTDLWLESVDSSLEPVNSKGNIPTLWVVPEDHSQSSRLNFGEKLIIK